MALMLHIKYVQVLPHPPNHPRLPVHLVLTGARRHSSTLCRILRPKRRHPGWMRSVRAFLSFVLYRVRIYPDLHVVPLIRHVSVSTRSSEILLPAWRGAVAPPIFKWQKRLWPQSATPRRRVQVIIRRLS
jgi:hypothetical protein